MNEQQLTSLELSKKLAEAGFEKYSGKEWAVFNRKKEQRKIADKPVVVSVYGIHYKKCTYYPAYDLLWDICVKHGKELFGEEIIIMPPNHSNLCAYIYHTRAILALMIHDKPQESVEQYIIDNCILFKNK